MTLESPPVDPPCAYHEVSRASDALVFWVRVGHYLRTRGVRATARRTAERLGLVAPLPRLSAPERDDEVLGLTRGELVVVKDADEIRDTLDERGAFRGLHFMDEMWKYCGGTFVVLKRMERLMVERTGTMRSIRNTVLLESTQCDGSSHRDCDASCQHLWREVWLRRVDDGRVTGV